MKVQGNCGIKTQTGYAQLASTARIRQDIPALGRRIAHKVAEERIFRRGRAIGAKAAEEKAIAAVQKETDAFVSGKEGQKGANQRQKPNLRDIEEMPSFLGEARVVRGAVEYAGKGLGEPPAVLGVGDEGAPEMGDALEAAERLDWSSVRLAAGLFLFFFLDLFAISRATSDEDRRSARQAGGRRETRAAPVRRGEHRREDPGVWRRTDRKSVV